MKTSSRSARNCTRAPMRSGTSTRSGASSAPCQRPVVSRSARVLYASASLLALAACARAADAPVKSSASVTQEIDGTGRLDLVFVNRGRELLGVELNKLELAAETSAECKAEGARLESGAYGSSIDLLGQRYTTSMPAHAWARRQLRVPASLMNVGCVLRIVAYAGTEDGRRPSLVFLVRRRGEELMSSTSSTSSAGTRTATMKWWQTPTLSAQTAALRSRWRCPIPIASFRTRGYWSVRGSGAASCSGQEVLALPTDAR